jgi:hypothetical protein
MIDMAKTPSTIDELVEYLLSVGVATPDTLVPCSPAEVEEVREARRVDRLPPQYEQFLLAMGRRSGDLLRGTTFFYPGIVELADELLEVVEENNVEHLVKPGSVLLGMHQGVELYWMDDDPSGTTYEANETGPNPTHTWPSLLDCLLFETERHLRIKEKIRLRQEGLDGRA